METAHLVDDMKLAHEIAIDNEFELGASQPPQGRYVV